jgi:hypothetical protein
LNDAPSRTLARRPASGHLASAATLLALFAAGCPTQAPMDADAASPRDATVVDSTLTSDAASDVGTANDATTRDGGVVSCGGSCDPLAAITGCGVDLSCRLVSGIPVCAPHPHADGGLGTDGASCAYDADCADGLACFGAGGLGVCGRLCCGTRNDCEPSQRCRGDGALVDGTMTSWGRCLPPVSCDLAHPDHACSTREGCYIVDQSGATECLTAGHVPAGAACTGASDCVPGYVCAGLTARTCIAVCLLSSTAPHQGCADTEHCEAQAYSPTGTGICTAS